MKSVPQRETNPFPYSDSNKRYHTYDYYLRRAFGAKCAKIPLDGGFTCPNRDGTKGVGGCIYCSARGSGEFAPEACLPIAQQYEQSRELLRAKWGEVKCIPYFQANTNTYAPVSRLRELFNEAIALPDAVGLNVATRADCLPDEVLDLLAELSEKTVLTVELGLQTVHDETAAAINRGHTYADFLCGYCRVRERVPRARIGVHLILGLIGENDEMMVESAQRVAELRPDEVKLHSLYVLENTKMAEIYRNGGYKPIELDHYVDLVTTCIRCMPPETVIGRLTGDAPRNALLAPMWTRNKRLVLNKIDKKFYQENIWQGKELY